MDKPHSFVLYQYKHITLIIILNSHNAFKQSQTQSQVYCNTHNKYKVRYIAVHTINTNYIEVTWQRHIHLINR